MKHLNLISHHFFRRSSALIRFLVAVCCAWSLVFTTDHAKGISISASVLPSNFQESIVFNSSSGIYLPTAVRFASDGRVFVADKRGIIHVFAGLSATTSTVFADLSTEVDDYWDRGLLGLALDPNFPTNPYVYVLYTYDAPIGGTAPVWNDACPTPPGATTDGCVVSGRLSRLTADPSGNTMVSEQVLINDWCQQFPSHSIGDLRFGPDGALYVSGGDGASFGNVDYGQYGNTYSGDQANPCGDPPNSAGTALDPPGAEGGALRSQSLRRGPGDPVVLNGAILRVDPATGNALSTNPLYSSSDANARRIIGYGMRNPFRFTFRPGTNELWIGDVGWNTWEEINRIINPTASPINNFGWPCYEGDNSGSAGQSGYQSAGLNICTNLPTGSVTAPYYSYQHGQLVAPGDTCTNINNGSVVSALTFYSSGSYPNAYNGALFFADHSRNCIWVMFPGSNGLPDKSQISTFATSAANPVDLEIGPGGDLFYVDFDGSAIRRIQYFGSNQPPVSVIAANPTSGTAPLTVSFDGSGSYDTDAGDSITAYSWDLNGDGIFGDASTATTSYTYNSPGTYTASLRVTDKHGATNTSSVTINANNTAPTAVIDSPAACSSSPGCWIVGQTINFSGHATDPQQGTLPASALTWNIILHHCSVDLSSCHTHLVQTFSGVASGSFTAPDHDYPSYLEIQLVATDSGGLQNSTSVLLYPKTVNFTLQSNPSGLQLNINGTSNTTTFVHAVIINSNNSVSAPTPQTLNGVQYAFQSWSDGGAQTHNILAGTTSATYTANYTPLSADVQIVKTGVLGSGKITYTLQVKNNGPASALGVVVKDTLPSKVQFVSASSSLGSCSGTSTVTCSIGTMSNGQTVTVTIVVNVMKAAGFVTNTATVSASTPDQNTGNSSSSVQVKAR